MLASTSSSRSAGVRSASSSSACAAKWVRPGTRVMAAAGAGRSAPWAARKRSCRSSRSKPKACSSDSASSRSCIRRGSASTCSDTARFARCSESSIRASTSSVVRWTSTRASCAGFAGSSPRPASSTTTNPPTKASSRRACTARTRSSSPKRCGPDGSKDWRPRSSARCS